MDITELLILTKVDHRNRTRSRHIVTIEDPIEYLHDDRLSFVSQREVGTDAEPFAAALRGALRQTPDVLLIGEMRDADSATAAVYSAETGHLVLSTLHTINVSQALDRIRHFLPPRGAPRGLSPAVADPGRGGGAAARAARARRRVGARGRGAAGHPRVRELLRRGDLGGLRQAVAEGRDALMQTFDDSLFALYQQGADHRGDSARGRGEPQRPAAANAGVRPDRGPPERMSAAEDAHPRGDREMQRVVAAVEDRTAGAAPHGVPVRGVPAGGGASDVSRGGATRRTEPEPELRDSAAHPVSPEAAGEWHERFREYRRTGSRRRQHDLVCHYLPFVHAIARRYVRPGTPFEDLAQIGMIGLINAVRTFDPDRGVKFETYGYHHVAGEIRHFLRDGLEPVRTPRWLRRQRADLLANFEALQQTLGRTPRLAEVATCMGVTEQDLLGILSAHNRTRVGSLHDLSDGDGGGHGPEPREPVTPPMSVEDRIVLFQAMDLLAAVQRKVVYYLFYQDLTQTEVAQRLGVSQRHVSRLLASALRRLAGPLRAAGVDVDSSSAAAS